MGRWSHKEEAWLLAGLWKAAVQASESILGCKKKCPERDTKNAPVTSEIYFITTEVRNKLHKVLLELKFFLMGSTENFSPGIAAIVISRMYNFLKVRK